MWISSCPARTRRWLCGSHPVLRGPGARHDAVWLGGSCTVLRAPVPGLKAPRGSPVSSSAFMILCYPADSYRLRSQDWRDGLSFWDAICGATYQDVGYLLRNLVAAALRVQG